MALYSRFSFILTGLLLALCTLLDAAEVRTWTSADGRKLEAEFVTAAAIPCDGGISNAPLRGLNR